MMIIHNRIVYLIWMILPVLTYLRTGSGETIDPCRGGRHEYRVTDATIANAGYPQEWTRSRHCGCAIKAPTDLVLFVTLQIRQDGQNGRSCEASLVYGNQVKVHMCSDPGFFQEGGERKETITMESNETTTIQLSNPYSRRAQFTVTLATAMPRTEVVMECGTDVLAAIYTDTGIMAGSPTYINRDTGAEVGAIVAISVIVIIIIAIFVAAYCKVLMQRKKIKKRAQDKLASMRKKDAQAENPGYEPTPKSSMTDVSSDPAKARYNKPLANGYKPGYEPNGKDYIDSVPFQPYTEIPVNNPLQGMADIGPQLYKTPSQEPIIEPAIMTSPVGDLHSAPPPNRHNGYQLPTRNGYPPERPSSDQPRRHAPQNNTRPASYYPPETGPRNGYPGGARPYSDSPPMYDTPYIPSTHSSPLQAPAEPKHKNAPRRPRPKMNKKANSMPAMGAFTVFDPDIKFIDESDRESLSNVPATNVSTNPNPTSGPMYPRAKPYAGRGKAYGGRTPQPPPGPPNRSQSASDINSMKPFSITHDETDV